MSTKRRELLTLVERRRVVEGCLSLGRDRRVWTENVRTTVHGFVALRTQSYFVIESNNDQRWWETLVSKYHAQYGRPRLSLATMATSETSNHLSLALSPFVRPSINLLQRCGLIVRLSRSIYRFLTRANFARCGANFSQLMDVINPDSPKEWSGRVREKPERGYVGLLPVTVEITRTLPPIYPFLIWELRDYIHFLILSIKLYRK